MPSTNVCVSTRARARSTIAKRVRERAQLSDACAYATTHACHHWSGSQSCVCVCVCALSSDFATLYSKARPESCDSISRAHARARGHKTPFNRCVQRPKVVRCMCMCVRFAVFFCHCHRDICINSGLRCALVSCGTTKKEMYRTFFCIFSGLALHPFRIVIAHAR